MASFTDAISQFNPYVSQLPIDAMVKVGMYKQQKYDEGVQKIQGYIDSIAGLDVVKPLQKQYLQSKLDELGSKLKTVAAGDFSNFQLVNSVGGMSTQIVKDPIVNNAVMSTQKVRKGQQDKEAAIKSGKSSPENDWWWDTQVGSWINDGKLDSSFNGGYLEYIDVDSKLREVAEKVKEVDNSIDIPYQRDNAGNYIRDKNGNLLVDDAMLRVKTKGKSAQKLLDNFYSSLDEREKQQLGITGMYHYRGATKDTFKRDLQTTYDRNKKMLSDEVVDLAVELRSNPNLTSVQRAEKEAQINRINETLRSGKLDSELRSELSRLDSITNIEDYKSKLYTQKYLTNLAQDMSYQSYVQEIQSNPYAQMNMEKKKLEFQVNRARQEHAEWSATHALNIQKFQAEETERVRKSMLEAPVVTPGGLPTSTKMPTLAELNTQIEAAGQASKQLDSEYAPQLFSKLSAGERQKALQKLVDDYNINPRSIKDPLQKEYVERKRGFEIDIAQKNNLFKTVHEGSKQFDEQIAKVMGSEGGVNFANGKQLYSAEELFSVVNDAKKFIKSEGGGFGGTKAKVSVDKEGLLAKYRGTKYEPIARAYSKRFDGQPLTSVENSIINKGIALEKKYQPILAGTVKQKLDYQSAELAKRMPEYQVSVGTIDSKNENVKRRIDNLLGNKFREFETFGAVDVERKGQFDPSTITELQKNPNTKYTIEKKFDGSANMIVTDGSTTQVVPMTTNEFSSFFPDYAQTHPLNSVKYAVMSSPNHTTNLAGGNDESAAVNAYFTGYNIPGLAKTAIAPKVRLDVEGNPFNNGGPSDKYSVRMYVYDGNTWKTDILNQQGFLTEDGVLGVINNIGTNTVEDLLKKNR
jgi:hypothetical protein